MHKVCSCSSASNVPLPGTTDVPCRDLSCIASLPGKDKVSWRGTLQIILCLLKFYLVLWPDCLVDTFTCYRLSLAPTTEAPLMPALFFRSMIIYRSALACLLGILSLSIDFGISCEQFLDWWCWNIYVQEFVNVIAFVYRPGSEYWPRIENLR